MENLQKEYEYYEENRAQLLEQLSDARHPISKPDNASFGVDL